MLQLSSSDQEVFKKFNLWVLAFQYQTTVGWGKGPWNAASSLCFKQQHIERIKDDSPPVQFLVAVSTHFHYKDSAGISLYDIRSLTNGDESRYQTGHLCLRDLSCFKPTLMHRFLMHRDFHIPHHHIYPQAPRTSDSPAMALQAFWQWRILVHTDTFFEHFLQMAYG